MVEVILSLGGNLGDRSLHMQAMEREIRRLLMPPVVTSGLMETEPVGVSGNQPWYYNRLMRGGYNGTPRELLNACLAIELKLGRTRPERYAPRTADIDLLLFGNEAVMEPDLVIPHPAIQKRMFCVLGLLEIAADWIFPGGNKSIGELADGWLREVAGQRVRMVKERCGVRKGKSF
jgi:2-amino-4-hydroxy-6-hydroxymethyldihydropteridine diphosphokinase